MPPADSEPAVAAALDALRKGQFVLVYDADGREEETDLVVASEFATPSMVARLREDAGGLVCTTLHPRVHEALGLPYLVDVLRASPNPLVQRLTNATVPYEPGSSKPSFGLSVNHRDSFTGITDRDRALTIRALAEVARMAGEVPTTRLQELFAARFRAPGHVFLLNAHPSLLAGRQGHTELSTALVTAAGLAPTATICEMMGGAGGRALPKAEARAFARDHGWVFLEGRDVVASLGAAPAPLVANPPRRMP